MVSSGTMFSLEVKQGLLKHIPGLSIVDVLGSTEGGMGQSTVRAGASAETARFKLNPTTKVITEDGREVVPGSGEVGLVANGGMVPLGYYKDPEKSARTFREVNGVRYSFPGDMATVEADGRITLLGRGSNCINTGGEKVFPEEVEEALKVHPAVEDTLVFGVPDERFGQRVVGVASLCPGSEPRPNAILAEVKGRLASYKLPKELLVVATRAARAERQARLRDRQADLRVDVAIGEMTSWLTPTTASIPCSPPKAPSAWCASASSSAPSRCTPRSRPSPA